MKNYPGPLYAPWSAVVQGRGFDPVEERMKEQWRKVSNDNIAKNLLDSIAELLDGKWHRSETLDSRGNRTERFIIERDITEEPDSSESDVSGSDSSDS
jgi:hypothetical protein|tara:strand:- start:442 stop:735 length:294 start_codon:yes stop_codon:yes gene_type:complete